MKDTQRLRQTFGITQQQLALLLGISRSALALYETGKRFLPLHTNKKLEELNAHLYEQEKRTLNYAPTIAELERQQKEFTKALNENNFQQRRFARQIEAAQTKIAEQVSAKISIEFAHKQKATGGEYFTVYDTIALDGEKTRERNLGRNLPMLEMKLKVFAYEGELLQAKLKEITKALKPKPS